MSKTLRERFGHVADQVRIKRRTRLQRDTKRINHTRRRIRAVKHGRHQPDVELRLRQHAGNGVVLHAGLDLCHARGAWIGGVAQGNRAGGRNVEIRLEILIGIMKHHKAATTHGGKDTVHFGSKRVELSAPCGGVCGIAARIFRIGGGEFRGDQVKPNLRV